MGDLLGGVAALSRTCPDGGLSARRPALTASTADSQSESSPSLILATVPLWRLDPICEGPRHSGKNLGLDEPAPTLSMLARWHAVAGSAGSSRHASPQSPRPMPVAAAKRRGIAPLSAAASSEAAHLARGGGDDASPSDADAAAAAARPRNADASNARCSVVVLDGANLAWTYSASLFAKLGCRTRLPLSRGVVLAMESEVWRERGVTPVAFMPASYVEGPLHGLADGGDLDTLVPGNVRYLGDGRWRNTVLWEMATRGALQTVNRPPGARDSDDKSIIAHAREVNGMICSNDRYEDHCVGGSGGGKDLRRWLRRNRRGYEFRVGSPTDASFKAGRSPPAVSPPPVGCAHLPPPPPEPDRVGGLDGLDGTNGPGRSGGGDASVEGSRRGWRADVHAVGSSRPWGIGQRWGRDGGRRKKRRRRGVGGGARRERSTSDSEPDFPFWALPDDHLPVEFALKKSLE